MIFAKMLFSVFFLYISSSSCAQNETDSLEIEFQVKDEYVLGDTIDFKYINKSKKDLYIGISLERQKNDEDWTCLFKDVFRKYKYVQEGNIVNIVPETNDWPKESFVAIKDSRVDNWIVDNCLYADEQKEIFRFKFTIDVIPWGFKINDGKKCPQKTIRYSKPFIVKKGPKVKNQILPERKYTFVSW